MLVAMNTMNLPTTAPPGRRRSTRDWPWWLFRVTLCVQALDSLAQAVLAGRFLSGDFAMLAVHEFNATRGVVIVAFAQIVVAVLAWRRSGGPGSLVVLVVLLGLATVGQIVLGFTRVLGLHIPLGVAIIATAGWLAVWVCTHRPTDRPFARREPRP